VQTIRGDAESNGKMRRRIIVATATAALWCGPVAAGNIPQQIIPQFNEVGIGSFVIPGATATGLGADSNATSSGSGSTNTDTSDGLDDSTSSSSSSSATAAGSSSALDTMMGTSWGAAAASNATALGVNPSALAATCVAESGCRNVGGTGSITGAFQMTGSTYTSSLNAALAQDPNLSSNIVSGIAGQNDPATQSIAASEYLAQGAQYLENQNVANPTVLDVRGYYNFGPTGGAAIANADGSDTMSQTLSMYTPAQLAANGITAGETVAQWRSSVASTIGNAANQQVLL
jgi:hypothetical protein